MKRHGVAHGDKVVAVGGKKRCRERKDMVTAPDYSSLDDHIVNTFNLE